MKASEFAGLHHVQLAIPAAGEDLAREFYVSILGMAELTKPPALATRGGCWFRGGGWEVHLGVDAEFRSARKAHPGVIVTDLEELAARLTLAHIPVEWDDGFPGYRRFYVHDPHGNRLEFLEPDAEERDQAGSVRTAESVGTAGSMGNGGVDGP